MVGYTGTESFIGSIAGRLQGTVENCVSYATVKGVNQVGGIIGARDNAVGDCKVIGCSFGGEVIGSGLNAGGIMGGISDGSDIVVRAGFKPTPSVAASQQTINKDGENIAIEIKGRHDPIVVARAVVVVECMTALVLADALLVGMSAKLDNVKKVWALDEK